MIFNQINMFLAKNCDISDPIIINYRIMWLTFVLFIIVLIYYMVINKDTFDYDRQVLLF